MTHADPPRVLFLSTAGPPYSIGGHSVFAHELARALIARGVAVRVAYHQDAVRRERLGPYDHDGVPYHVLPPLPGTDVRGNINRKATPAVPGFEALLAEFAPAVLHLHDFSVGCNLTHLRAAAARGVRTVMTYHSPGQSCPQTELRFRGRSPCDGELRLGRCSECRLAGVGVPAAAAWVLGRVPLPIAGVDYRHPALRTLTSRGATRLQIRAWREMVAIIDLIHTHAAWVYDVMRLNRVPPEKLVLHRTGLPRPVAAVRPAPDPAGRLRVALLGRCDRVKGIDVLTDAVRRLPAAAPVVVSFFGPHWGDEYGRELLRRIGGDPRFRPPAVVPPEEIGRVWADTDVLAVPSVWLETGPLVVLEAFAAGVPVVGSALGGIAELVTNGTDGLLVPPGDTAALAAALGRLIDEPDLLARLRAGIRPPRTLGDLADDLILEYDRLTGRDRPAPAAAGGGGR